MAWEDLEKRDLDSQTRVYSSRLRIPGGWIVRSVSLTQNATACAQTFIADVGGEWKIIKPLDKSAQP